MFLARKQKQLIALALLIASLFAQGVVAASGCLMSAAALSAAIAGASNPHCDSGKRNPNLCLVHSADQSDQNTLQPVIAASTAPGPTVADAAVGPRVRDTSIVVFNAGHDPPIPIRFCSFLI